MQVANENIEVKQQEQDIRSTIQASHEYDYFIEGYDLPPEKQAIRDRLLTHMPTLKTKTYRDSLLKIVSSLSELNSFSDNLQSKVDCLLQAQETTFVQSYKHHINKIQLQFDKLHSLIQQLEEKIRYYQNEGKMSALVKKVFQLEQESSKLFKTLTSRDKQIRDLELTVAMQKRQMKILQETVKSNAREKSLLLTKDNHDTEETPIKLEDITVFATELGLKKSSFTSHPETFDKGSPHIHPFHNNHSLKSVTVDLQNANSMPSEYNSKTRQKSVREAMLSKENNKLKMRNQKLMSHQVQVFNAQSQLQQFFVKCVDQLKKEIRVRKKISFVSLEDFKKEDKLMLMIKILSNEQILTYLYQRIFKNHKKYSIKADTSTKLLSEDQTEKLPKINFNLSYQAK